MPRECAVPIAEFAAAERSDDADFEGGYADAPRSWRRGGLCVSTGVSCLSLEYTRQTDDPLYEFACGGAGEGGAAAIDKAGAATSCDRAQRGPDPHPPRLGEAIRRLKAYSAAGADCLYAPGITTREQIKAVVDAVAPKPVNVLMGGPSELTVRDLEGLGVRRISVGGALARAAWGGVMRTAKLIAEAGSFKGFADAAPGAEIAKAFK